jgi:hypothetical protein
MKYHAEQGMTWLEWATSDYNVGGWNANDFGVDNNVSQLADVVGSDVIIENHNYRLVAVDW